MLEYLLIELGMELEIELEPEFGLELELELELDLGKFDIKLNPSNWT
jgi:hypothetical protein